jgi:Uncharacterized conserved protein
MKRYALTATLLDDPAAGEAYERHHAAVWPEVVADIGRSGVRSTRIYRSGRSLVMILETGDDFDLDTFGAALSHPRTREWQALMDSFMEQAPGSAPGLRWTPMRQICEILDDAGPVAPSTEDDS